MKFWDSSAVVPLLVRQPMTKAAERLLEADPIVALWWASQVECTSALTRLARDGRMEEADVEQALARLDYLLERSVQVDPFPSIRDGACRLLRVHPLRAADALQLAAALEVRGPASRRAEFVCFDARLATAARREGFVVP